MVISKKRKNSILIGTAIWISYCCMYIGRMNFSASISTMVTEGAFSKTELGTVSSAFFLCYALFQIPSGILGNVLPAATMIFAGFAGSAIMNFFLPLAGNVHAMRIIWGLNGIIQALVWPSCVRMISELNRDKENPGVSPVAITFCAPVGTILAYLLSAITSKYYGWEMNFYFPSIVLVASLILFYIAMHKEIDFKMDFKAIRREIKRVLDKKTWLPVVGTGLGLIFGVAFINGILKEGLTTWIPTYLKETLQLDNQYAILLTMLIPVFYLIGAFAGGVMKKQIRNEMHSIAWMYGLTFLSLIILTLFFSKSIIGTIVCFATTACMMMGINVMDITYIPIEFHKVGIVAVITGLIDAVIYSGTSVSGTLFAYTSEWFGWSVTRWIWCGCAAVGILISLLAIKKWGTFLKEQDAE